jgi:outer membrane immunogenic protein
MKKLFFIGAALAVSFATPVMAADMPVKAPPLIVAPVPNWSGCYVGAHVGYGWARKENSDDPSSNWFLGQPLTVYADGFIGGGQVGCNYQWTSDFVIGIEGEFSGTGIRGSTRPTVGFLTSLTAHAQTNSISTVTGRLGYSWSRALLYVKGGGAWAHDEYSGDWAFAPFSGTVSASETRTGWTLGVGFEHALDSNWSARIEYDYYNFGTRAVSFPVGPPVVGTYYVGDIHQEVSAIKLGVNYRFGGPLVARY